MKRLAQAHQRAAVRGDGQRRESLVTRDGARLPLERKLVDAHRAGVVDRAVEVLRVRRPRETFGRAVPGIVHDLPRRTGAAVEQHQALDVTVETHDALLAPGEPATVGAVERHGVRGLVGRSTVHGLLGADRDREHVEVDDVRCRVGVRDESELLAVGSDVVQRRVELHGRARQLEAGAEREIRRVAACHWDAHHVQLAIVDPGVPEVDGPAVPHLRRGLGVGALLEPRRLLVHGVEIAPHAAQERDPLAVGEPHRLRDAGRHGRQARGLATCERHQVELRRSVAVALADEGDRRAVRADHGRGIRRRVRGERALHRAVGRPKPQVRERPCSPSGRSS